MAEFVELRSEEWIPELEQLERIRLFDAKEIKSIITKKKEFEYKMQRKTKFKEDFVKYIQFEVDLYRLVKARRHKFKINAAKSYVEGCQTNRITRLFKQAIFRFQDDTKLWMSFFKYCQEAKLHKLGSQMLVRMLQVHADKENLWSFAAKWDLEELRSVETARRFLLQGIRHHPESELLYTELFKLELGFADDKKTEIAGKRKREEEEEEEEEAAESDVLKGRLAEVVYENALTKIKSPEFKSALLSLATEYPWTKNLQNRIFQDLMKEHSECELTWDVMAKRELRGLSFEEPSEVGGAMEVDLDRDLESRSQRVRILRSVDVYEGAVKKLNTRKMWSLYLDHLINMDSSSLAVFKSKLLRNALEGALAAKQLSERHYLHWVKVLRTAGGKQKKVAEVLARATEDHPESVTLWHARLRFHLARDQEQIGASVFAEAVKKIPNAVPIWKAMIQYYQTKTSSKVEDVFRAGIDRGGDLSLQLKPMYLQWTAATKGMGCARKLFESPEMLHPPCLPLLSEMISLETGQPDMNKKSIRRCHEMACNLAGKDDLDVWIAFVEFELKHGEGHRPFYVYMRAVKTLSANLVDEFVSRYNALKIDA